MKKTILLALLLLMIPAICSAGPLQDKLKALCGAAACSANDIACTSTAEELFLFGSESGTTWIASKFVATANSTICSIVVPLSKNGTGQDVIGYIYSHDGTWDEPETLVGTGSVTIGAASIGGTVADITLTGVSAEITNTTVYWLVLKAGGADGTNNLNWHRGGYNECTTYRTMISSNGTSWNATSTSRSGRFQLKK